MPENTPAIGQSWCITSTMNLSLSPMPNDFTPGRRVRILSGSYANRSGSIDAPTTGTWPNAENRVGITLHKIGSGATKATKAVSLLFTPSQFQLA